jgi:hypothetical protein
MQNTIYEPPVFSVSSRSHQAAKQANSKKKEKLHRQAFNIQFEGWANFILFGCIEAKYT